MLTIAGTPLEQTSWNNQLIMKSKTRDVYQDFAGTFSDNKKMLPNGIQTTVNLGPSKHSHVVGLLLDIEGDGVMGRESQIGKEKDQELKELIVYSNDLSQAVNTQRYGIDAHDKKAYRVLEMVNPQLSLWHKEIEGKATREGLLQRYSSNLLVAPTNLVQRWNENIFIKGVTFANQPVYDSTNASYETNISGATTGGSGGQWDVTFLNALIHEITVIKAIQPLDNERYVVTVPSRQAMFLKDPGSANSIAGLFKDSHVREAGENAYKYYLGSYGPMDLYEDPRAAVVNITAGALVAQYKGAGTDDTRYSIGTGTDFDVSFVHGKGSYMKAIHEALHFEEEIQNYKKIVGVGAFTGYGINRTVFDDVDSPSDTSQINQNSIAIFAETSLAAV